MEQATIDDALNLISRHFAGLTDEDGEPYVMHCIRVMQGVEGEHAKQVALMHDLVEDTPVTLEELRDRNFAPEVVEAVDLVTHPDAMSYADYVVRLKKNPIARQVKMSDLRDNSSIARVLYRPAESLEKDLRRIQKYILSYQFLQDRLSEDEYLKYMAMVQE